MQSHHAYNPVNDSVKSLLARPLHVYEENIFKSIETSSLREVQEMLELIAKRQSNNIYADNPSLAALNQATLIA